MPRVYKTPTGARKRKPIDKKTLRVSSKGNIRTETLKRYVKKTKNAADDEQVEYAPDLQAVTSIHKHRGEGVSGVFNPLMMWLMMASKLYHGLTPKSVRQIVFQYACENKKNFSPKWAEHESATL